MPGLVAGLERKAEEQLKVAMAENKKMACGDLIEINRGIYNHWSIYVGNGYVIHLVPPSEHADAGSSSVKSVLHNKAIVRKEPLKDVVGNDEYNVRNLLDEQCEPRPITDILQDAEKLVGKELPYDLATRNCEHFITMLRYGKPHSQQVQDAVYSGAAVLGILAAACSEDEEMQKK
ncbi:hypothetical protein Q8A67_016028 [Cirrhinus molitorella]|uniref:LRAT domain-containing protein n=1 Tax=Cirrhinus molitorella TaxID=172907 RepID=A0AA88PUN2_9TELE|nr:hypothetical protein Q8A67_016028 [Cirrhinus molitorella]